MGQEAFHLGGERRAEFKFAAVYRVQKAEAAGVQREPAVGPARMSGPFRLVAGIAQHGVAQLGEVDANLVAPTRFESHAHMRRVGPTAHHFKVRDRSLADFFVVGREAFEFARGGEQRVAGAAILRDSAGDDRFVFSLRLSLRELVAQQLRDLGRLAVDEQP